VKRLLLLTATFLLSIGAAEIEKAQAPSVYELKAAPGEEEASPRTSARESGPIEVTVEEAILLALKNNRSLRVEQFNTTIQRTFEDQELAVFDPVLSGSAQYAKQKELFRTRALTDAVTDTDNLASADIGVSKFFPTGTAVDVDISAQKSWSDLFSDQYASRAGFSVTQALLQGRGTEVNLATLHQAQLATQISEYEFRGFAETLVAAVEESYWDYALAGRQIEIFEESLKVAEQQLREIEEMISVGRMAETEVTAAQAEIAVQRQGLIAARGNFETTRLRFLRLLNPGGPDLWDRDVLLKHEPRLPEAVLDPAKTHVDIALKLRPDLNQAKLGFLSNNLEIVKTKNGLLPRMDFFVSLGKTGYADSFGSSVSNITDHYYDVLAGVTFRYPLRNRDARARHERSILGRDQAVEAIENLEQLIEVEVRTGYIEVASAREQVLASRATLNFQEEKLRIETEKLRVGRSTAFLVSQAQRDLISSKIAEISAVANYLKALVTLYRLEGSLLERRGIVAPGRDAVTLEP